MTGILRPKARRCPGFLPVLGGLLWVLGCSSDTTTTQPTEAPAPPSGLTYVNGDGSVALSWQHSSDHLNTDFQGYYIYRDTLSMKNVSPTNLSRYRQNGTPVTANTYSNTVEVGTRYYFAVRAANQNGDLSTASEEINTAARPLFEGTVLHEFSSAGSSGLECSTGSAYRMLIANKEHIDVYLGTADAQDALGHPLALKSPHLVGGPNDWSARVAQLKLLGGMGDDWNLGTTPDSGWATQVVLGATSVEALGKVIALRTPMDQGLYHYAKIRITGAPADGANGERSLEIKVAYQMIPGYIRFSRPR